MILETFPSAEEFYKTYWGKKPFIVRGFIPDAAIDDLVDGDTMAGLALEDEVKSRIITNNPAGNDWSCEHGPFAEERFDDLGDRDWSLLVQNVEQYHTDTADLLQYFQFSPRWLIEDIMVSYSAPGGSVGPHTDSYHTFLVQGIGKRTWKISAEQINDDCYIDNPDMKVLQNGFEGEVFEVTSGDVIYMPPFFGHEGKTIEAAMTFSVGFLGPKLSDILSEYAHYLEENEALNKRYLGENLDAKSAAFSIAPKAQEAMRGDVLSCFQSDDFAKWMAAYFSTPAHDTIEGMEDEDNDLSYDALCKALQNGAALYRPEHVKLAITNASSGDYNLAAYGGSIIIGAAYSDLIAKLSAGKSITIEDIQEDMMKIIHTLYDHNIVTIIV